MLLTEYDEEKVLKAEYYVGMRAGLEQGLRSWLKIVAKSGLPIYEVMETASDFGITSEAELRQRAEELGIRLPE